MNIYPEAILLPLAYALVALAAFADLARLLNHGHRTGRNVVRLRRNGLFHTSAPRAASSKRGNEHGDEHGDEA